MSDANLAPVHPGEILTEDFLVPLGISQYRLAKDISVPPRPINEIVHGKRSITADTALRLARHFGTSESSGSTFRPITTWRWRKTASGTGWRKKLPFSPGLPDSSLLWRQVPGS
jgi:addiction module HigA family antidote